MGRFSYDRTKHIDTLIEENGLEDLVEVYEGLILVQREYFREQDLLDQLPVTSVAWHGAVKAVTKVRREYVGYLALCEIMCHQAVHEKHAGGEG